jgi:two-component sensor histidine kinase
LQPATNFGKKGKFACFPANIFRDNVFLHATLAKIIMASEISWSEQVLVQSAHLRLTRFTVPTRRALISPLRERLLSSIRDFNVAGTGRENHFCMALEEALNNAFYHGNLEISSELKEDGTSAFIDLAREREQLEPWRSRNVYVTELVGLFGLWISIEDDGNGFNVEAAFEPLQ